jgi:hypothetical protein
MNYHAMEYCELKQEAKERRIKMYYVMRKAQLIELLSAPLPEKYIVEKKTILKLREEARAKNFIGIYKFTRGELVELLYPQLCRKSTSHNENKNENNTYKHNSPEKHYSK